MRRGQSGVNGPRCFLCYAVKVLTHRDVSNLYGISLIQALAHAKIRFAGKKIPETMFATPADAAIGYTVEVDLKYPDKIKQ